MTAALLVATKVIVAVTIVVIVTIKLTVAVTVIVAVAVTLAVAVTVAVVVTVRKYLITLMHPLQSHLSAHIYDILTHDHIISYISMSISLT